MAIERLRGPTRASPDLLRVGPGFRPGPIAGRVLGPASLLAAAVIPGPLTGAQQGLPGLSQMAVIFWVARALPLAVTSILTLARAVVMGIARASRVFGAIPIIPSVVHAAGGGEVWLDRKADGTSSDGRSRRKERAT